MSLWQGWDGSPWTPFWFFFLCIFLVIQWVCGKVGMGRRNQWHKRKHSPPPCHENSVCGKSVIIFSFTVLCFKGCHTLKTVQITLWKLTFWKGFYLNFETLLIPILCPSQCGSKSSPVQKLTASNGCDNRQISPELA